MKSSRAPAAGPGAGDVDAAMRYALSREQAGALGRAGRRLTAALAAYRAVEDRGDVPDEALVRRVAEEFWSLLVQREVAGFVTDNVAWLRREFDLPEAVINRAGIAPGPRAVRR